MCTLGLTERTRAIIAIVLFMALLVGIDTGLIQ